MKSGKILYCGDCRLDDAAKYLAGAMKWHGHTFDYVESDQKLSKSFDLSSYRLFILSDYPSKRWGAKHLQAICDQVESGAGLWMIGGWGSFKGVDGDYQSTPLADILPVKISAKDDRRQGAVGYRLSSVDKKMANVLDFVSAPVIAGFNQVTAKKEAQLLLQVQTLQAVKNHALRVLRQDPLLVFGKHGAGKVLAYMSDLAPHWSGGLVDWGSKRIQIQLQKKVGIQVANQYLKFIGLMLDMAMPTKHRAHKL